MLPRVLPLFLLCGLLAGCSSLDTHQTGDLRKYARIFVEHRLTDNHHLDELIVAELKSRGYDASCGHLTMLPEGTDAIISYRDRWAWDFKSYLIELQIDLRANFSNKLLASGHYHQASARTKPPAEVIHLIIDPLFKHRGG